MKLNLYIWFTSLPGVMEDTNDNDYALVVAGSVGQAYELAREHYVYSRGRKPDEYDDFYDDCHCIGEQGELDVNFGPHHPRHPRVVSWGSCSTK